MPFHSKRLKASFPPTNSLNAAVTSYLQPAHAVWGVGNLPRKENIWEYACVTWCLWLLVSLWWDQGSWAGCFVLLSCSSPKYCFGESRQLGWDLPQLSCKTSLCDRWPFSWKVVPVNPTPHFPSFTIKPSTKQNKLGKTPKLIWQEYFLALGWGGVRFGITSIFKRATAQIILILFSITLRSL